MLANFISLLFLTAFGVVSCGGSTPSIPSPLEGAVYTDIPNKIGINIAAPSDYQVDRLYANAILSSRSFIAGPNENVATPAQLDPSDKWPIEDFSFYVFAGTTKNNGTYTLSFVGKAAVSGSTAGNIPTTYDALTNTSTGTIALGPVAALALRFVNTQRTNASAAGTGVTSIKLMRPLTPGSSQSYPTTALFTDPIKALIAKFSVIRFMDYLATNSNQQKNWTDRPLPSWPSLNRTASGYGWQGIGGCWEHVILLANETGKDAWINIPAGATDAYIENVALMFKYGSDGINPYTSVQANPAYPPLNSNLKLYVEYSNEPWNTAGAFTQSTQINQLASDELVATSGSSPINWDSIWSGVPYTSANWNWYLGWRYHAKRGVDISTIFRTVFGDAEMMSRIRPVLMNQLGYSLGPFYQQAGLLLEYYNNLGGNFVGTPHPPSYFFYGAGGSSYYGVSGTISTLDQLFSNVGLSEYGELTGLQDDMKLVAALGLKRVAYEGGPSLDKTNNSARDAISAQAVNDPRMTTAIIKRHRAWNRTGGDLLVYYVATGDYQWGFTDDVYNLATPKLLAIDALNATTQVQTTFGTLVPATVAGTAAEANSRGWGFDGSSFTTTGSSPLRWASWSFRSTEPASWTIDLSFTGAPNATVGVYVDGVLVGTQSTVSGSALSFDAGQVAAGIHGVIVRVVSGSFTLASVAVAVR